MIEDEITIPYYVVYASEYIVFRGKLSDTEIVEVFDAVADVCLFGNTEFSTSNFFQQRFFDKIMTDLSKNAKKYITCIENGKKGGRPKGTTSKKSKDWKEMLDFFEYSCVCCGAKLSEDNPPTKDHIIPISWGGADDITNWQPLCRECNSSKCADHSTDYRLNYNIPDELCKKWGIIKTEKKPMGFENNNLNKTQQEPRTNLDETNIKENNIKENNIKENNIKENKKIDTYTNPITEKCFSIYSELCSNLPKIRYERRNKEIMDLLSNYLFETENNLDYFKDVCIKANNQKTICDNVIDFKSILKNHIAIYNEKFKKGGESLGNKLKFK